MAGFFSRNQLNEIKLKVDVEILNVNSQKMAVTDNIKVQWKPETRISTTKKHTFLSEKHDKFAQPSKQISINEKFERLSTFSYTNKGKFEWLPLMSDFKLVACREQMIPDSRVSKGNRQNNSEPKVIVEKKFDLSVCIGSIQDQQVIDLGKGFSLDVKVTILPACPDKHAELFKMEAGSPDVEIESIPFKPIEYAAETITPSPGFFPKETPTIDPQMSMIHDTFRIDDLSFDISQSMI